MSMLKKQKIDPMKGVCAILRVYTDEKLLPAELSEMKRAEWDVVVGRLIHCWNKSTALPSSGDRVYPVKHPTDSNPSEEYYGAFMDVSLWEGEYGENRKEYLEFLSDYIEEYWK